MPVSFTVNGTRRQVDAPADTPLLYVLRNDLQVGSPQFGCGLSQCGACSVLVDGKRTFSCSTIVREIAGKKIRTVEGLASGDTLHPVQQAFLEEGAYQCGYCTAGMIMGGVSLLERERNPTEEQIRDWMNPQVCRCCTYPKIVAAIRRAAELSAGGKAS